jgi:hypothetical protein
LTPPQDLALSPPLMLTPTLKPAVDDGHWLLSLDMPLHLSLFLIAVTLPVAATACCR